jgi:hypothetical protein
MPASFNQDFVTFVGDAVSPIFLVVGSDGVTPVDISGATQITWTAQRNSADAVALTKTKTGGGITFVTNGTDGKFQVAITSADTSSGLLGWYAHTASILAGGITTTVEAGRFVINPTDWTWNPGSVGVEQLYTVRQLIGDYVQSDQLLTDSQIRWALTRYSNEWQAAAECCRNIAANFARQVDIGEGPMKKNYSQRYKAFWSLGAQLHQIGMARGGVTAYVGGISVTDKVNVVSNTDRVSPNFVIAMHDNLLPEGPVGLQTNANLGVPTEQSGDVFNGP